MPTPKDRRFVFVCELDVRPSPTSAPDIQIEADVFDKLTAHENDFMVDEKDDGLSG